MRPVRPLPVLGWLGGWGDDDDTVTCTPRTISPKHPLYSALQFFRDVGPLFFSKSTFRWLTSAADKVCGTQCSKKCVILRTRFCTFPSTAF